MDLDYNLRQHFEKKYVASVQPTSREYFSIAKKSNLHITNMTANRQHCVQAGPATNPILGPCIVPMSSYCTNFDPGWDWKYSWQGNTHIHQLCNLGVDRGGQERLTRFATRSASVLLVRSLVAVQQFALVTRWAALFKCDITCKLFLLVNIICLWHSTV